MAKILTVSRLIYWDPTISWSEIWILESDRATLWNLIVVTNSSVEERKRKKIREMFPINFPLKPKF